MKRIIEYIIGFSIMLALSGCESFLTQEPQDFISPEASYDTEEALEKALAGVYDMLGHNSLYGGYFLYYCGFDGDDGHYARNSPSVGAHVYNFSSTDITVFYVWEALYKGISRANMLLKNVDVNPEIEQSFRGRVRGEALCLRAFYYFHLVTLYGDVPLLTEPVTSHDKVFVERTESKKVYEQIMADLIAAEPLVRNISEIGHGGAVSKSAVRGLAARVCLHWAGYPLLETSKYEDARTWALKVINDETSKHELAANYADIFIRYAKDEYDWKESIWEVEFHGTDSSMYEETTMNGRYIGPSSNAEKTGKCLGTVYATGTLFDKYPVNDGEDRRKYWNIACFSYDIDGSKEISQSKTYPSLFSRFMGKVRREYWPHPESETTSINVPLLRYSDVLLMYAEAENAINGPTEAAIGAVNEVRRRTARPAGIKSITITDKGSGYDSAPTVSIVGTSKEQAFATATIGKSKSNKGKVIQISLINPEDGLIHAGAGFESVPEIIISGGGGSGATAVCDLLPAGNYSDVPEEYLKSSETFLKFIQDERSRELCFECLRRGDLIRWGIFNSTMNDVYNLVLQNAPTSYYVNTFRNATNEKHLLWPIPAQEIAANPLLTQNKNW